MVKPEIMLNPAKFIHVKYLLTYLLLTSHKVARLHCARQMLAKYPASLVVRNVGKVLQEADQGHRQTAK